MELEQLKYPIGKFQKPAAITSDILSKWIHDISSFPVKLVGEVKHLTNEQLDTPYRPGGWTIRQVVHHCADSHMNAFIRIKLTLTEDKPTIKPYFEDRWAELTDSKTLTIAPSLEMIEGIHNRWAVLLKNLSEEDFGRAFIHPEHGRTIRLDESTGLYAWHCNHHLAHITETKKRETWE